MASSRRGYSKAQTCFFKILHTISSIPPSSPTTKGLAFDLNLTFSSLTRTAESKSSRNDARGEGEPQDLPAKSAAQVSETVAVDDVESESPKEDEGSDGNAKAASFGGREDSSNCFDLLIEAVRVLSEEKEKEPVVRSKRGRNRVLPNRLRDSVVEPLKRSSRTQRTSSTSHLSKRLLRSSATT